MRKHKRKLFARWRNPKSARVTSRYVYGEEKRRLLEAWRKAKPVRVESAEGEALFLPNEIYFPTEEELEYSFAAPESPLWQEIAEAMSKPLCPECSKEPVKSLPSPLAPPRQCPHGYI